MMSLQPHWYSTIYGLYFFAGGFLSALAFLTVFSAWLLRQGIMKEQITIEHFHDLGKLMFGFTIFWGYMAFSQYFLIWYANIPEETIFFMERWEGNWKVFSLFLVFGNFLLPFIALITRAAKRSIIALQVISFWILFAHWIDLYWNVYPNLKTGGIRLSWMDATLFAGIGGIFITLIWKHLSSAAFAPVGDPKLAESVKFMN
jgi:hypothetical protein